MNVEIGAEAALFPEKEYISGIFVAVQMNKLLLRHESAVQYEMWEMKVLFLPAAASWSYFYIVGFGHGIRKTCKEGAQRPLPHLYSI